MTILEYAQDMFVNPERYRKFYIALATAVLSWLATGWPDATWLPIVIQFAGAIGVFGIPNQKVSK